MPFPKSYPETLRDLADCIEQTLGQIAADPAIHPALAVVEGIRTRFGGSLLYIPKGAEMDRATRDAKLCAAFTGRNHHELSRRYGISISCVYRSIARAMKAQ